ncbi:MAG: PQQ-binding-like beta-propeller repeat protein, partial [Acidobacteriia bacterium]|nr:PQQ-binding-like beta-propeller repeat protein [Terriglobia bacterium]
TGMLYVMSRDACGVYYRTGHSINHQETGAKNYLRAIELATGDIAWEVQLLGVESEEVMFAGAMATAGGLVFFGSRDGSLMAADANTGEVLWHFNTGGSIRASPVTFEAGGRQYVAITTQAGVFAFGLFE